MSANITGHVRVSLGDVDLVSLQALGDRGRQDVEQEALAPVLLDADLLVLRIDLHAQLLLLAREVPEERIDHHRDRGEVEHEEHGHRLQVHLVRRRARQQVVEHARHHRHEEPREEPRHGLARAQHRDRAHRRHEAPQAHARGIDEVADGPLHREGREEDQPQLDDRERVEALQLPPQRDGDHRERLEDERDRGGVLVSHAPVHREPEGRRAHHERGGEHQHVAGELLLGRQRDTRGAGAGVAVATLIDASLVESSSIFLRGIIAQSDRILLSKPYIPEQVIHEHGRPRRLHLVRRKTRALA
jgi:hypothetical protein